MTDTHIKYDNDVFFHNFVDGLTNAIKELRLTPMEVREAAMLACINYEYLRERSPMCYNNNKEL